MGQNNNCLQHRDSYSVERKMLVMKSQGMGLHGAKRKPRARNAFSTSTPLYEEGAVLEKYTARRTSEPSIRLGGFFSRRSSAENIQYTRTEVKYNRRSSLQDFKVTPRRRGTFPFSVTCSRALWHLRSFSRRKQSSDEEKVLPQGKIRNRSASLGQTTMAHHKHRPGTSPTPKRAMDKKNSFEGTQPQHNQEYDNSHHQPESVESLVRKCAACFDQDGECQDEEFPRLLFLTHAWFMTSEQLLVLFSQLYEDESTPVELKKQIFFAIRYWMKEFPHVFDLDATLVEAITNLQNRAAGDDQIDASWIDLSNRGHYRWMRPDRLSVRPPQGAGRKRRKVSLVFHHLEPEELAIHISYLEFKCFRRLTFDDFHQYAIRATIKDIAKLERCVFLFNNITFWVQVMVLGQHTPQERAAVITKYIKIAQKLREMRNYNTLMAVVGGLTHTAIARLKKTMSALSKDTIKALEELVDLVDSRSNYVAYRRDYAQQEGGFKIPVIGVHLKDIIGLHTALPDRVGDELINVKKMMSIGSTFQELLNLQRISFPHEVNKDLVNTLRVSLYLYYTEEEIYALSLQREPKDPKYSISTASSPSKVSNMVFAEFTKFTCQLDNDTVTQHVTAMVESVFKAYDHDNDGFISEEEFYSFKDNFPMMESFSAMDVDGDGRISRTEMCEYFMKASACKRNDFCQNFTHEFVETTYFHPTFCEQCEKLLWGLVKQGWKCKGCAINCHKHCKDRIVLECRPKSHNSQHGNTTNNSGTGAKTNGARQKSSVSSESDLSANGDVLTAIVTPAQNQTFDDEAFEGPTELHSSFNPHKVSPSTMRRSTSLASADVSPRNLLRQLQDSKTPPALRKVVSAESNISGGQKSFRKTMQKIMPRRNNSNKTRASAEVATQTAPHSPTLLTPSYAPNKSFLYPRPSDTSRTNKQTNGRLGSNGEELEESPVLSHLNNNHVITRVTQNSGRDVTVNLKDGDGSKQDYSHPTVHHNCYALIHPSMGRRDSGLSGCSAFTFSENSIPATPVSLSDYMATDSQVLSKKNSTAFKFPPSFTYDDVTQQTTEYETAATLVEENARLRETNKKLLKELEDMKLHVKRLENRALVVPKTESGR